MKKHLILSLLLLLPMLAGAESVLIDGIYYNLIPKGNAAEVTSNPNKYSGSIVIPDSISYEDVSYNVTLIGESAFSNCNRLTSVTIPENVISIGNNAFRDCSSLSYVFIGNGVTTIGNYAFYQCSSLFSLIIGNRVKTIGDYAFFSCSSLTDVNLPNSLNSIGNRAFEYCSSLTDVNFPNNLTTIGSHAFYSCSGITSIFIPKSVTSIQGSAFLRCSNLVEIIVEEENAYYDSRNNCNAIIERASNTLLWGCANTIIPNSVTSIYTYAFVNCINLKSITIPNSVKSIGYQAFQYCSKLSTVFIGSGVTTIGGGAFSLCPELTDVYCFAEDVPSSDIPSSIVPTNFIYDSYIEYATLHVPASFIDRYQASELWNGFRNIVPLDGETPPIPPKCAFPTIAYANGKLTFDCDTEGVEFVYTITIPRLTSTENEVLLDNLTPNCMVSVYAKKEGYENSDVATCYFKYQAKKGDTNGDGEITISDAVGIVNIILGNGNLNSRVNAQ